MKHLGQHIILELHNCSPDRLDDITFIEETLKEAARLAGATVVDTVFHHFSPYGISGVVVIAESHLAIHTWPEYGYAAIDMFTCGEKVDPYRGVSHMIKQFKSSHWTARSIMRGTLKDDEAQPKIDPEQFSIYKGKFSYVH